MKLGVIKRISREVLAREGDIPKWVTAMLEPLNDFIEKVGLALQGRLTFEDNFLCKPIYLEFTHGVEQLINPRIESAQGARVIGVLPIAASGLSVDKFKWVQKDSGNIGVTIRFSTVLTIGDTHSNTTLDNLKHADGIEVGMSVSGSGISAGTTVASISGTTVTLSQAATATASGVGITFGAGNSAKCRLIILLGGA